MTEIEWMNNDDHRMMMWFLNGKISIRKLQLFASACCRRAELYDHSVIELIEGYADRKVKRNEAMKAVKAAIPAGGINAYCSWLFWGDRCHQGADIISAFCAQCAVLEKPSEQNPCDWESEQRTHADLLRCIVGNPFRPASRDSSWLTSKALNLAQQIYDQQNFNRLSKLAEVLEKCGCTDSEILTHCRQPGPHSLGCWVLDLILDKN